MSKASKWFERGWFHNTRHCIFVILIIAAIVLQGCSQAPAAPAAKEKPSVLEEIDGSDLKRVVLTEKAAQRIGVQTVLLKEIIPQTGASSDTDTKAVTMKKVEQSIPYAAVIYDIKGDTWIYTNPEPLSFVRQHVSVDRIDGDWVVLAESLPENTRIVTVGVAELYGAETGIGK